MRYFAGVEDALGIDWQEFKTMREAEAYAEAVQGIVGISSDNHDIELELLDNAIIKAVSEYENKKTKHINVKQGA